MSGSRGEKISLALLAVSAADVPLAAGLARELDLPIVPVDTDPAACEAYDVLLVVAGGVLALQQTPRLGRSAAARKKPGRRPTAGVLPGPVAVDFGSEAMRHRRRSGHNELLGRAVGVQGRRQPRVLDATAGLGRDSFVLADMGCAVTLCERNPVIAAMLARALQATLSGGDDWSGAVVRRMSLVAGDARGLSPHQLAAIDVIYLDPMFPRRDKSAAVKKEMALFQALLAGAGSEQVADELLPWALAQDVARVVIKRPSRAPFLGGRPPSHSVAGKAVRFDVHVRRPLPPA